MTRITGQILPEDTWRMEQFSRAYVHAVSSVADCSTHKSDVDNDSIDLTLARRTNGTLIRSPKLDLQLKSTTLNCIQGQNIAFDLSIKNYNDLRSTNVQVPRILIVVTIPNDFTQWIDHDETRMLIRKCGYWYSLRGLGPTSNAQTQRVIFPRAQVFDVDALHGIFTRLEQGLMP